MKIEIINERLEIGIYGFEGLDIGQVTKQNVRLNSL
jgi:hypothetical protein